MPSADDNQNATEVGRQPDDAAIRKHIEWLIAPARGHYDDALVEIAYEDEAGALNKARLYGLDEIDEAVAFAVRVNVAQRNVYVGAALRLPETERRSRCDGGDFYVAFSVAADIDENYDDTRGRMAEVVEDALVVVTGTIPARRSQHWVRLVEPCEEPEDYARAASGLVLHIGADAKVRDAARVMRLGGTISWPSERKRAKGYKPELTRVIENASAKPVAAERLFELPPLDRPYEPRHGGHLGGAGEIVRDGMNLVVDGRETFFRDIVHRLVGRFQEENGSDPTPEDIWADAFALFCKGADNSDGRWTSEAGQRDLHKRVRNTIRRLKAGHLPIHSIETGKGKEPKQPSPPLQPAAQADDWGAPVTGSMSIIDPTTAAQRDVPNVNVKQPSAAPKVLTFQEFIAGFKPPKYLIRGMIQTAYLYSLTAQTGHGKSALAMLMSAHVTFGLPFAERPVSRGNVLYLAGENPDDICTRYIALFDALGLDTQEARIDVIPAPFNVQEHHAFVSKRAEEVGGYSLIIVDTLMAYFNGDDDNSNAQMAQYARDQLRPLTTVEGKPTVIVLAHPRKGATESDMEPRGGGAFIAEMDGNLTVWLDGGTKVAKLHHTKLRGIGFDPIKFEMKLFNSALLKDDDGNQMPSMYASFISEREEELREARRNDLADDVLLAIEQICGRREVASNKAISDELRGKISKATAGNYTRFLKGDNFIHILGKNGSVLTQRGEEEVKRIIELRRREFRFDG